MSLSLEGLRAALEYANVRGFTHAVQRGEVPKEYRHKPEAYRVLFGGALADDLSRHPRTASMSKWGWTSAAGAYQAMCAVPGKVTTDTWGDFCRAMGTTADEMPFDPDTQDAFCVWCIKRRGALQDVIHGEFDKAVAKCALEWSSFPGNPYGQPTVTIEELRSTYMAFGGTFALGELIHVEHPAAPIEERDLSGILPRVEQESTMPEETTPSITWGTVAEVGGTIASFFNPLAGALLMGASKLLQTKVETTLNKHTDPQSAKMIAGTLSDAMISTAKLVTNRPNEVDAVLAARSDPKVMAQIEAQVEAKLSELAPMIEQLLAIEKREQEMTIAAQDAAAERNRKEAWDMTRTLVYAALVGAGFVLLFFAAVAVIQLIMLKKIETEVWAAITGAGGTVFGIAGTIFAYRFASTVQSMAKNALIGEIAKRKA